MAWPTYSTVAKACHLKKRQTVAAAVEENIRLGYLVPIGNIADKTTWAKKIYPDGKWAYIFKVNPPQLPNHKSIKSACEDVRKTDTLKKHGAEKSGAKGVRKTDNEGVRKTDTILGINTTLESTPKPLPSLSAEGGDINPSPKSKEHLKAAAEYVTSNIRRLDRRISQYQEFASRLSGENADNMETLAAQIQMHKAEQTIRLGRIERALQA